MSVLFPSPLGESGMSILNRSLKTKYRSEFPSPLGESGMSIYGKGIFKC